MEEMSLPPESVAPAAIGLTAEIVSAYVANNPIPVAELPRLLASIHAALGKLSQERANESLVNQPTPAEIRRSITPDALISFEDGKPYKTLRRHLTLRGLTAEAYRSKWGLAQDYPMTAAAYSEHRSALARSIGLGRARQSTPDEVAASKVTTEAPKKRGRKKAAEPRA